MKNKKIEQPDRTLSARKTAEQFWEDLMKMPYSKDRVGLSFVIVPYKRLKESEKPEESQQ